MLKDTNLVKEIFGLSGLESILATKEAKKTSCEHMCTSMCRHNGCNCEHGEWHEESAEENQTTKSAGDEDPYQDFVQTESQAMK